MSQVVLLFDLGLLPYEEAYSLQKTLVQLVAEREFPQTLLLLEHPPVYTVGKSGSEQNLSDHIPVLKVDRGGDITYHGPGQLIGYPLLQLESKRVSHYIRTLEESLILLLKKYSIEGSIKEGFPGVWVGGKKIASIGVRIKRGITYHGFALNVTVDLSAFQVIKPCGLDVTMTSMEMLSRPISMQEIKAEYARSFETCFEVKLKQKMNLLKLLKT